jgi:hypothetical protein
MMPDMLVVAALELGHPVLLIVLMEADNAALPGIPPWPITGPVRRAQAPPAVGVPTLQGRRGALHGDRGLAGAGRSHQ